MTTSKIIQAACFFIFCCACAPQLIVAGPAPSAPQERMVEWTIESGKAYADPFNDVDVDVVFERHGQSWRVPTFWRGGSRWTVRFAPPAPGEYTYHLESTDRNNPDLNGHKGRVTVNAYSGANPLLRHGMLQISANKRYLEHADGSPFYWLGDTWWIGLSTRLSWEGFQKLTADRKEKGFTLVQTVAGLIPAYEEPSANDPGYCNEGGCVWDAGLKRINPGYFDSADRRIQHLVDSGLVPAIVGAWQEQLERLGVEKLKKHWRYVIARYGAYPVVWIVGGEVFDPPEDVARKSSKTLTTVVPGGWTSIARYIRATDPTHHPVTVHEVSPDDLPLQDESVTDFHLFQPSHFGWNSIAVEISELDTHYARTEVTKPLVVGEIGYEKLAEEHLENFQRAAFWLGMLNGAAGHTYGANGVWESYTADKLFQAQKYSLLTWEEGMKLPGSYQIGLGAKLLRQYPWWRFQPHPEWVTPRGTTMLEPRPGRDRFHIDAMAEWAVQYGHDLGVPESEWHRRGGNFFLPYAAGIPGEVRFIYIPYFRLVPPSPPTILGIEPNVRYHAYYWDPSLGIKIDLGAVERPPPGQTIQTEQLENSTNSNWTDLGSKTQRGTGGLSASGESLTVLNGVNETNVVAAADVRGDGNIGLVLRFHGAHDYLAAMYSPQDRAIYLVDNKKGERNLPLGRTPTADIGSEVRLTAQARGNWAVVSVTDGAHTYTSEIVRVGNTMPGATGFVHGGDGVATYRNFELRSSPPPLITAEHQDRTLHDANGTYRGELQGTGRPALPGQESSWGDFGKEKIVLLDAYRPERLPYGRDWLLVLEAGK